MNDSENVDHDAVLRARTTLLGSGRIGLQTEIQAYRVLAEVSPSVYLPRLAWALLKSSYQVPADLPKVCLAVLAEAAAAARRIEERDPKRPELLIQVLGAYQRQLYLLGRRAEGFSVREEMARTGQLAFEAGHVESPVHGLGPLAAALAEEGRHLEAAQACGRIVEAERVRDADDGVSFWNMVEWAAELDAAGLHDAALDAFVELVSDTRAKAAEDRTSLAILSWELVRLSQMLDARERYEEAATVRGEVGALLKELADTGEPKGWSNIVEWTVLLALSGRADDQPPPGEPAPPVGLHLNWSPDLRQNYFDGRAALREEAAALTRSARSDPRGHLPGLVGVHRRLTIRSAIYWEAHTHLIVEPLRPLFDEGVSLARQLAEVEADQGPAILARALTDRSTFFVASKLYAEAHADFEEAVGLRE